MTKTDSQSASRSSSSGDQPPKQRRKPGRAPVSCAECRRLKLRCDRKVPCETCVKRGCSAICPEGSLTTGNRTNRLAFADAEELQKNVDSLRSRVAELEAALRKLQAEVSNEPHPLLVGSPESSITPNAPVAARPTPPSRSDPSPASHIPQEEDDFIDAFGTLTLGLRGESRFYGPTSRAEFLVHASRHDPMAAAACSKEDFPGLSEEIFEEALKGYESTCTKAELKKQALEMLPPLDEACRLCDIFLEHGSYLWQAIPRAQLYDEILSVIYRSFPYPPNVDDPGLISTHAVSLLFIILGLATLFDPQAAPYSTLAKEYFLLSRLALRFVSPMQDTTLWAVQTTVYQVQFMQLSAQDPSHFVSHQSWIIMGFAVKLGNSIGLHVRSSKWQLDAEASRRRAGIFWQSFALDTWLSFHFGRPPCMSLAFIDCEFPTESENNNDVPQPERQFQPWIWQYTRLVSGVMSTAFGAKTPTYSTVIDLDRKIRDFPVPHPLRCVTGEVVSPDLSPTIRIQRYFVMASKEIIILHLHRPYFAQALCDMPHDLLKHRFGPSVMATYRSAWRLIEALQDTYRHVPFIFDRVPIPWSYAISAAIAMCLLASRAPTSPLAPASVHELWRLVAVFEQGAATSQTAAINLEVVRKMHRQAQDQTTLPETRDPSNPLCAELDRLGGKTQLIATEGYPRAPSPGSAPTTSSGPSSVVGSLPTPPPPPPTNGFPSCPSKCNPHPLLVSDLHTFEGFNTRTSAASHDNTSSSMDFDFSFDLSQAFPLPLESQYGYYHAQQQNQQEYVQQLDSSLWECQPPLPDYTGYFPQDGYDSTLQAMEVQGQVRPQQGPAPSVGVVQGLPAMPVLDATWQSFVEQLGF